MAVPSQHTRPPDSGSKSVQPFRYRVRSAKHIDIMGTTDCTRGLCELDEKPEFAAWRLVILSEPPSLLMCLVSISVVHFISD